MFAMLDIDVSVEFDMFLHFLIFPILGTAVWVDTFYRSGWPALRRALIDEGAYASPVELKGGGGGGVVDFFCWGRGCDI